MALHEPEFIQAFDLLVRRPKREIKIVEAFDDGQTSLSARLAAQTPVSA